MKKRKILKRVFAFVIIITTILVGNAQDYYQVTIGKMLNVRNAATSESEIIAQLEPNQEILVYGWDGNWAQIYVNGQPGYVYSNYITYLRPYEQINQEAVTEEKKETILDMLPDFKEYEDEGISMIFFYISIVVLVISVILGLLILCDIITNNIDIAIVFTALFFVTCSICEFAYIITSPDPLWFCSPSVVGWLWTIVNFILFGIYVAIQCVAFVAILNMIEQKAQIESCLPISIIGVPICVVGFSIFTIFWMDSINIVFYIGAILILLQISIILYKSFQKETMGTGLLMSVFYLLGLVGTVMMLIAFLVLFIVAAMIIIGVCLALVMLAGGSTTKSSRSDKIELRDEYGRHVANINRDGWGDDGNRYRKNSNGDWYKD